MSAATVQREDVAAGVCRIVLDRPPLNVLTIDMLERLAADVAGAAARRDVKVLVLTGAGTRAFCAGVDVADHTAERVERMLAALTSVVEALLAVEQPVVAVVNGAALGGGLELALAADVILARSGAVLGQPEIRLGAFPPAAAALLPRLVGRQRALDLILTGRTLSAEEARAAGLVAEVLPDDAFEEAARAYGQRLASLSGPVLRLAKRAVLQGLEQPLRDALAGADRLYLQQLVPLRDSAEGLAAFMEKREPVWEDR